MTETAGNSGTPISPYQQAMQAIGKYEHLLQQRAVVTGKVDPIEMLCTLRVLVLEVTALRELLLDVVTLKADGTTDLEQRMSLLGTYCLKLKAIVEGTAAELQGPKIITPGRH